MTFLQFAEMVRKFRATLTPEQAHIATEGLAYTGFVDLPHGEILETALQLAWAARPEGLTASERKEKRHAGDLNAAERRRLYKELEWRAVRLAPEPKRVRRKRKRKPGAPPASMSNPAQRSQPSERARALVRERLADGPKPGWEIEAAAEAAAIPEHALIAAADELGVVTARGVAAAGLSRCH